MTPQEALRLLDMIIAETRLTRPQHIEAQQALLLLEKETERAATLDALLSAQNPPDGEHGTA